MGKGECCKKNVANEEAIKENKDGLDDKLREIYTYLSEDEYNSTITKRCLTNDIVEQYENTRTDKNKFGLARSVIINMTNRNIECPRVCDKESYENFSDFFLKVIEETQVIPVFEEQVNEEKIEENDEEETADEQEKGAKKVNEEKIEDNEEEECFDIDDDEVLYCQVSIRRNLKKYDFLPGLTPTETTEVKQILTDTAEKIFAEDVKANPPEEWMPSLTESENILKMAFRNSDNPANRNVLAYHYDEEPDLHAGFIVNYGDHLQVLSSVSGGALGAARKKLNDIIAHKEFLALEMESHPALGFLTFSPEHIGNGYQVAAKVRLPYCRQLPNLNKYTDPYGINAKFCEDDDECMMLTNQQTMNVKEEEVLKNLMEGIKYLINDLEKELAEESPDAIKNGTITVESLERLHSTIKKCDTLTYTRKYLSQNIVSSLKNETTNHGGKLAHCVRVNAIHDRCLFPRACDSEAYNEFSRFFNPILLENNRIESFGHPGSSSYGTSDHLTDFQHELVKAYKIRFIRNLHDYPFPMILKYDDREELEEKIIEVLSSSLNGKYYELEHFMEEDGELCRKLKKMNLVPGARNPADESVGVYRDWPDNRGVFVLSECPDDFYQTIIVNERDHICVQCVDNTGKRLPEVYDKTVEIMKALDNAFLDEFATKYQYGYLTFSPQDVGTGMRVSAHLELNALGVDRKKLDCFCEENKIQYQGLKGPGSQPRCNVFDIACSASLGVTERQSLTKFIEKLKLIIKEEEESREDEDDCYKDEGDKVTNKQKEEQQHEDRNKKKKTRKNRKNSKNRSIKSIKEEQKKYELKKKQSKERKRNKSTESCEDEKNEPSDEKGDTASEEDTQEASKQNKTTNDKKAEEQEKREREKMEEDKKRQEQEVEAAEQDRTDQQKRDRESEEKRRDMEQQMQKERDEEEERRKDREQRYHERKKNEDKRKEREKENQSKNRHNSEGKSENRNCKRHCKRDTNKKWY